MNDIETWIDSIFKNTIPDEVVAIAFNLYEEENNHWSIEMIGSSSFDAEDSDWACDEIFDTRDHMLSWTQDAAWEEILQEAVEKIQRYTEAGTYAEQMKSYSGIGVGFVDGDLIIIHQEIN